MENNKEQFSKMWMRRWQIFCMFWLSVYCTTDIYFNKGANVNNVIMALITSVVATLIPYFAKSFLETKEEKKNEMLERAMDDGTMINIDEEEN